MAKLLRHVSIYLALASALTVAVLAEPAVPAPQGKSGAKCGPKDQPETGLQGQVPREVQDAGFEGFWCNARLVGHQNNRNRGGNHQVAWWDHCVYEGNLAVDRTDPLAGTAVIDVSNPTKPRLVKFLQTPGSLLVTESLHTANGLLVSSDGTKLDVYDISRDCARPRLKAVFDLPFANHGAWLSYDAKTWYGLVLGKPGDVDIEVVDLTNPVKPELLMTWSAISLLPDHFEAAPGELNIGFHDMSTNKKGTRLYLATDRFGQGGGLTILNSTDIVRRRPNPEIKFVSYLDWLESPTMSGATGGGSHTAWLAHFNGKPFILAEDEGTALFGVTCPQTSLARTIDISEEESPEIVSTFQLEVNDPANCGAVTHDEAGYFSHYIGVDDVDDTRLVFYAYWNSGLRIVDYKDPLNPKEIAYFNPPPNGDTVGPGTTSSIFYNGLVDASSPLIWYQPETCHIYAGFFNGGLYILELTDPSYNPCLRRNSNRA